MMRNLIVLGFAGMLMIGLSVSTFAGIVVDDDLDGVVDSSDNCTGYANGPLAQDPATPDCDSQEDGDADGYGNPCDQDTNNDGAAGLDDVGFVFSDAIIVGTNPNFDFNCDGGTGLDDVGVVFDAAIVVLQPGPSGLACAGTGVPCP
jgi:hypothetical protein